MRTYYISHTGNDANSGLTPDQAWATVEKVNTMIFEPGDHILFHAEGIWSPSCTEKEESFFKPKGSGTYEQPIVIGKYGSADYSQRPVFNGLGKVINTVHIHNVNHYVVENLEVTNYDQVETTLSDLEKELRAIYAENSGIETYTMYNITIQDCYVHHVNARYAQRFNNDGGIIVRVTKKAENITDKALNFDGLYIRRNTIYNVNYGGIFYRNDNQNRGPMTEGLGPWIGSPNIIIENNSLDRIGGDGIVVSTGIAPLVQYNVVKDSHIKCPDPCAAIWVINSIDAVYQYNEAYLTRKDLDGQAYDADGLCDNTVFQYNYSHDNEGGFMLICDWHGEGAFNRNGIVRYNISQNDRSKLIHYAGINTGFKIYNNTFYVGPGNNTAFSRDHGDRSYASDVEFNNNIFYNLGSNFFYEHPITQVTFNNNIFFGNHHETEPHDPNKMTIDPLLFAPGTGETLFDTVVTGPTVARGNDWEALVNDKLKGYKLMEGSPAIGAGIPVQLPEGIVPATQDIYGNPLTEGRIDIGAHHYAKDTPESIEAGTTWSFKEDYSDVAGQNNWYYLRFEGDVPSITTFDSPNSVRKAESEHKQTRAWRTKQWEEEIRQETGFITADHMCPGTSDGVGVAFLVPQNGVYHVEGDIHTTQTTGMYVAIKVNDTVVWEAKSFAIVPHHQIDLQVTKGDTIYFIAKKETDCVGDPIQWQPVITYKRG